MKGTSKLDIQRQQAKNLFKELSKAYQKCTNLCQEVKKELPNKLIYQKILSDSPLKLYTNRVQEIIALKNQMFLTLNEIIDIQQQYTSEKQKKKTFTQFFKPTKSQKRTHDEKQKSRKVLMRKSQIFYPEPQDKKDISLKFITVDTQRPGLPEPLSFKKISKNNEQYQLPIYSIQNNTTQEKLDSISKCIASLKKSMKIQVEANQKPALKQYLKMDTEYMKTRQQLQRFKMRQQEIASLIQKQIQKGIKKYLQGCQVVEETESYKLLKIITKNSNKQKETKMNLAYLKELKRKKKQSFYQNQNCDDQQFSQKSIHRYQSHKHFFTTNTTKNINQDDKNMRGILDTIGSTVENSQLKLKQLRTKRQLAFKEESDVWDQIQKL